jgi:hypothetical protein
MCCGQTGFAEWFGVEAVFSSAGGGPDQGSGWIFRIGAGPDLERGLVFDSMMVLAKQVGVAFAGGSVGVGVAVVGFAD